MKSLSLLAFLCCSSTIFAQVTVNMINPLKLENVKIDDPFWSPKLKTWDTKTVYDVFDKLEGKYDPDRKDLIDEKQKWGRTRNAFLNFDRVAAGQKSTQVHDGPPWYDGLVYETIRGAADLLIEYPDAKLEKKIDGYINRIAAAQAADPDGYVNTYTTLMMPGKRWGTNGGDDKWQHDIYNSGMLVDAAVHYYKATGKTKLLAVAVKLSNYMCQEIGPSPKKNRIPGHGGPEEDMVKLYWLFKQEPDLKKKLNLPVDENNYYALAKFWIEARGNYGTGDYARTNDSSYNQDHMPVLQQQTIEGHAVRATLMATGVAAVALESQDPRYVETASHYWDNMVGKRMFITGGEGALAQGERFGADYFLPESAYLETCAAIGAGFFTQRMNQLRADGKYVDELERILYNNLLSGVSLQGDKYFYENPLTSAGQNKRWTWHDCPCCPPMFLKMVSILPSFIYAQTDSSVYVNLFIGSEARIKLNHQNNISVKQITQYPWKGNVQVDINPERPSTFTVHVRIPGWAGGKENPFDLYSSHLPQAASVKVNGKEIKTAVTNGYVAIRRDWKKGDKIEISLPVQPRLVSPNPAIETIKGKLAIAAGPVVFSLEGIDNPALDQYSIDPNSTLKTEYKKDLLGGVNVIRGVAMTTDNKQVSLTAIPFYAIGNRTTSAYTVWLPAKY